MRANVVLVGLGSVGMGYDLDLPREAHALTHASAVMADPAFELVAGVDADPIRRQAFERAYGVAAFPSVRDVQAAADVVTIAVPTELHGQLFADAMDALNPGVVLVEKPMCASTDEARRLLAEADRRGARLFVNYHRAAAWEFAEIGRRLGAERPYAGVAWYTKGVRNNASHLLQLLIRWFGSASLLSVIRSDERDTHDPEPDFVVRFGDVPVVFQAAKCSQFSMFALELLSASGTTRLDGPVESFFERRVVDDPVTPGYRVLGEPIRTLAPDARRTMGPVYDNLALELRDEPNLLVAASEAVVVQELIDEVVDARC